MAIQQVINPNGPGTSFSGPVIAGPRAGATNGFLSDNQGFAHLTQTVQISQNGTSNAVATAYVPKHSQIVDFVVDTVTTWNSATSAVLQIGTTVADTTFLSLAGLTAIATTSGRLFPTTFTQAQLLAMSDTGSETVVFTVVPTGATTAGTTFVTMRYIMTQNYQNP